MSYRTDYYLSVSKVNDIDAERFLSKEESTQILDLLDVMSEEAWYSYSKGHFSLDDGRWYTMMSDMATLSLRFPDYIFDLEYIGEDLDDHSETTWINGTYHERWVEIPPYDPNCLVAYGGVLREEFLPSEKEEEELSDVMKII